MSFSNEQLRECFIPLLANSLLTLFPKVKLIEGRVSDHGFSYDFHMHERFESHHLKVLEERIALLIHDKVSIDIVSMLRDNALNFLSHHKQQTLAGNIEVHFSPGLMYFYKMDQLLHPCLLLDEEKVDASCLKFFKLTHVENISFETYRIYGTVFADRFGLKEFLKKRSKFNENYHLDRAKQLQLIETFPDEHFWLTKGLEVIDSLSLECKKYFLEKRAELFIRNLPDESELLKQARRLFLNRPIGASLGFLGLVTRNEEVAYSGLWRSNNYFVDRLYTFIDEDSISQHLISSLQLITRKGIISSSELCWIVPVVNDIPAKFRKKQEKLIKTLVDALESCEFSYKIQKSIDSYSQEVRAYLTYTDVFGKSWKGPFVGFCCDSNGKSIVSQSLYGSFDRYIATVLEQPQGQLPVANKGLA